MTVTTYILPSSFRVGETSLMTDASGLRATRDMEGIGAGLLIIRALGTPTT
jgi:hypothetical protein